LIAPHLSLIRLQFNGIWEILGVLGTVGDYSPKRVAYSRDVKVMLREVEAPKFAARNIGGVLLRVVHGGFT